MQYHARARIGIETGVVRMFRYRNGSADRSGMSIVRKQNKRQKLSNT